MLVFQTTLVTQPLFSVATVATAFGPRMTFGCSHFTGKLGKKFLQNLHIRLPDMVIVEHHALWIQERMLCFLEELLQLAA
jgi:hypothetical protein